jgi:hypothetical protein
MLSRASPEVVARGAEPRMVLKQTQLARIRGFALIFFVLLYVSPAKASPTAAQSPTCESHQLASLDLEIPVGGAVLVPVTVNRARLYMYLEIEAMNSRASHSYPRASKL